MLVQTKTALSRYQDADYSIKLALEHPRLERRAHLKPRWLFIRSCVEFLKGDVDASFKSLNQDGYLLKQVDDWNVQLRLLEMLQLLEQGDEEWLEFKLDATRKFLNRHKELYSERVRFVLTLSPFC